MFEIVISRVEEIERLHDKPSGADPAANDRFASPAWEIEMSDDRDNLQSAMISERFGVRPSCIDTVTDRSGIALS